MGTALLSGILKNTEATQHDLQFSISAPSPISLERLNQQFGPQSDIVKVIAADNLTVASDAQIIILAFQPQQLTDVVAKGAILDEMRGKLIISLLAGVSSRDLNEKIHQDSRAAAKQSRIARVIPSI